MEEETIEDVKEAYALLYRDMAALRAKADVLRDALERLMPHANFMLACLDESTDSLAFADVERARTAIANYTGA